MDLLTKDRALFSHKEVTYCAELSCSLLYILTTSTATITRHFVVIGNPSNPVRDYVEWRRNSNAIQQAFVTVGLPYYAFCVVALVAYA